MDRASSIGVDARVTPLDVQGNTKVVATEQRLLVIAFPNSDRVEASGAGDAYGDVPSAPRQAGRAEARDPLSPKPSRTIHYARQRRNAYEASH